MALNFIHSTAYNCSVLFREGSLMKNGRVPFLRDEHGGLVGRKTVINGKKDASSHMRRIII